MVLKGWKEVTRTAEQRERDNEMTTSDSGRQQAEARPSTTTKGGQTHTNAAGAKRVPRSGQGKVMKQQGRAAAVYHNCMAIARWMKLQAPAQAITAPATEEHRAKSVRVISKAWRELVRRRSAPGVGKRRAAGRLAQKVPHAQEKVKRKSQNVRNARKLFIGVNVRVALERAQPIGSSWRSEWDYG